MKDVINKLVEEIKSNIARDLTSSPYINWELLKLVLNAYNTYQEEERDGVDYIFDINKPDDLKRCIEGGMTAQDIAWLYEQSQKDTMSFFYFGINYQKPKPIANYETLVADLINWLDYILPCMLAYSHQCKDYEYLYQVCITNQMICNQLVP